MAVTGGKASFIARSTTASAAEFGRRLGVAPSEFWEMGDPARQPERTRPDSAWILDRGFHAEDDSLDSGLLALLDVFQGREAELQQMTQHYRMYVRCSADSDSTQGGFHLGAGAMRRMADLGLDLLCTVFLDDEAQ